MQFYNNFYKRFGVRMPQQLMLPMVSTLDKFEFCKSSLMHFVAFDNVHYGPAADDYLFRNISKQIIMDHIFDLGDNKGIPKKVSAQLLPYVREYHVKNRRFKYIKNIDTAIHDENTLIVVNYGFVLKAYRYTRSLYTEYYKWWNIQKTIWKTVNTVANEKERQQYIFSNLPKTLPSVNTLKIFSTTFNQQLVKTFNSPESLFLLELWKWLGEDTRQNSALADIEQKNFHKVNIVLQDSGKWIMFNLGIINDWRHLSNSEDEEVHKVKIEAHQLQRQFLRMLMSFMSYRSTPEEALVHSDTTEEVVKDPDEHGEPTAPVEVVNQNMIFVEPKEVHEDKTVPIDLDDENNVIHDESKVDIAKKLLDSLDDDLKELEVIESKSLVKDEEHIDTKQKVFTDTKIDYHNIEKELTPEEGVNKYCDEMAEDGLITASEYKNLTKLSQQYKTIRSPFKEGETLVEYAKINPEHLVIKESDKIVDIPTVTDKSMLKSSLISFDEKYIKNVLHKDISNMIINIQKAGVIVLNYDVEKIEDILGDYEMHTLRVRPVQGTASNLIFKLPVIDEDGTIKNNSHLYSLRKQRVDLPIRKTAPDTISLTTYYGKTFVKRSSKKVNDYASWLKNKVMAKGLDDSDTDVTNLATGNCFDNEFEAPRIYSILSSEFRSFSSGKYHFIFDHHERQKRIPPNILATFEKDGIRAVGYTDEDTFLFVDNNDAVYENNEKELVLKGSFETILKIDALMAPIDCSEIKIFGKTIAVGLILGYQLGLDKLMDLLKVSPRRVLAGQRLNLEADEYPIVFNDETLIFSKGDKTATMILAGFNEYTKAIKQYNSMTFNNPNVYYNILESSGINGRYLKEIDLMNELFVDPISKELLEEMKEPTTFKGLLVRSSELLTNDKHPDALDMQYMRIRGFERLAGAVYAELIYAIREQKGKSTKNRSPIELHPYAVWKRVTEDTSITAVNEINPIANIKEKEAVTYSGTGGRNSRSMTKATRTYHQNDMGVISEATKDSGDVAINTYTSADPQFNSLRGTTKRYEIGKTGATALLSTSALLAVGSDRDD